MDITAFNIFANYRGNHTWLKDRTVFLTKHGSHAYGTNGPGSDLDIKGVFMAPTPYVLGFDTMRVIDKGWKEERDPLSGSLGAGLRPI